MLAGLGLASVSRSSTFVRTAVILLTLQHAAIRAGVGCDIAAALIRRRVLAALAWLSMPGPRAMPCASCQMAQTRKAVARLIPYMTWSFAGVTAGSRAISTMARFLIDTGACVQDLRCPTVPELAAFRVARSLFAVGLLTSNLWARCCHVLGSSGDVIRAARMSLSRCRKGSVESVLGMASCPGSKGAALCPCRSCCIVDTLSNAAHKLQG